jgi:hypothetical protein
MSYYLVERIKAQPNIEVLTRSEVTALKGCDGNLETARWRHCGRPKAAAFSTSARWSASNVSQRTGCRSSPLEDTCGFMHFATPVVCSLLASPFGALAAEPSPDSNSVPAIAAPSLDAALVEYRRKLEEYTHARQQYGDEAAAYWRSVAEKRRLRNSKRRSNQEIVLDDYVLTQPPVYAGPAKPVDPSAPVLEVVPPPSKYVPVVADFLKSAEEQFNFVPQRPQSEIEYKRAYAMVASAAGLTKEQVVRIYGFEAGGNGTYDVQAGLEYPTLGGRASTTALGYNQLLNTTSVELMAEHGDQFLNVLKAKAARLSGAPKKMLESKIDVLQRWSISAGACRMTGASIRSSRRRPKASAFIR